MTISGIWEPIIYGLFFSDFYIILRGFVTDFVTGLFYLSFNINIVLRSFAETIFMKTQILDFVKWFFKSQKKDKQVYLSGDVFEITKLNQQNIKYINVCNLISISLSSIALIIVFISKMLK
jgi:hypothetical protein